MPKADAVDGKAKDCPLCGRTVPGGAAGMDRHFAADCTWRHTSRAPGKPAKGKKGAREGTYNDDDATDGAKGNA